MADETTVPAAPEAAQPPAPPEAAAQPETPADPGAAETEGHEPSADETGAEQPSGKQRGKLQKSFDKKTWQLREAQREAEYWREVAMRAMPAQPPSAQPATPQAPQPPDPSKYQGGEWDPEFQRARDAYVKDAAAHEAEMRLWRRVQQAAMAQHQQRAQADFQAKAETFQERQAAFAAGVEDYHEAAGVALATLGRNRAVADTIADAIADSDAAPEVLYFLGKNPAEARALAQMTPAAAARHVGRIEARLARERDAATAATKAPRPPQTVGGGGGRAHADPRDAKSFAEYEAARMRQIRERG